MVFTQHYPIRFSDTDAAGVVYFAKGLALCHAAYEDSLQAAGIEVRSFFNPNAPLAYPIVHASINYHRPLRCGDVVTLVLCPQRLDESSFEITYRLYATPASEQPLADALTRHCCIEPHPRRRHPLPAAMVQWLQTWGMVSDHQDIAAG
ncbi:MAG: hypothetical protein RLZZ597_591 [Cyanobacteriota bacterium]|jgi:1,4-dihydroxy-2-naphthoyl-CoA hydrolase